MTTDGITVITVTRGRPDLLRRALRSVRMQTISELVSHHVIVDDCPSTLSALRNLNDRTRLIFKYSARQPSEVTGPARAAKLRNQGVHQARTRWVAFLDDDNEFHPAHLAELLYSAKRARAGASHSYRELRNADGSPYLAERDPWSADDHEAQRSYETLVRAGVLTPGSNIMRDGAIYSGRHRSVDTSEWLVRTETAIAVPFRVRYSKAEQERRVTEDDTFFADLVASGTRIETTGLATLNYYMGGYSTTFGPDAEWQPGSASHGRRDDMWRSHK